MAQLNEVIKDTKFNDFLQGQIDVYNMRPIAGKGLCYKRTPFDRLKDNGLFNVESIRAEFVKIANGESRLSSAERSAITAMAHKTYCQTIDFRVKEAKVAERAKQLISE
jgi:hypothetical protein